jgi:hypothetical protein
MRSLGALIFTWAYMFALAIFLSLVALWVCDGYYPVGWGWEGSFLHFIFWGMPLSLVAGSALATFSRRTRLVTILLLVGTGPFIALVLWTELQTDFSSSPQIQSPWLHLWLIAGAATAYADLTLMRRAYGRDLSHPTSLAPEESPSL